MGGQLLGAIQASRILFVGREQHGEIVGDNVGLREFLKRLRIR